MKNNYFMKCLFCKSSESEKRFISTVDNIEYFICKYCKCHNQVDPVDINYNEDYWQDGVVDPDGIKRNFTEEKLFKIQNWYGEIINYINTFSNPEVLDVGCGLGYLLSALNTNSKTGLESSDFCVKFIKNNFAKINIIKGESEKLDLIDNKFDIVVAYHVIEHLDDPKDFFKKLKDKLKSSGKLIIGTPCINTLISNYFGKNYRLYGKSHKILLNEKCLKGLFEDNGFKIFKVEKPFLRTKYNNFGNFLRLFNKNKISPPFYGSIMTIYGKLN